MKRSCQELLITAMCAAVPVLVSFASCSNDAEYRMLKDSGMSGSALFERVAEYELAHAHHFESKLDLAQFYFLSGSYDKSLEYLVRAESVVRNVPRGKAGKSDAARLYGTRAELELLRGNYSDAVAYAQRAVKTDNALQYLYVAAQAHAAQENNDDALSLFDAAYAELPDHASPNDLRMYMYLLAENNRMAACKEILETYFEKAPYFASLGSFASSVYERCGDYQKAVLCAFLDYEYVSCFETVSDEMFLHNLDALQARLENDGTLAHCSDAIDFLRSYFTLQDMSCSDNDFFVSKYIDVVKKIKAAAASSNDVETLLLLETQFSRFPSYYWHIYSALQQLGASSAKEAVPILEKIIMLGNVSPYAARARHELGAMQGLTAAQSQKLLIRGEVDALLAQYAQTHDEQLLESIFALLELPDNEYELHALALVKQQCRPLNMEAALVQRKTAASPKLAERIQYILN